MSVCLQKKAIKRCACSPPCFPNSLHFILTIRNNLARHYPVMKPHRAWLFSSEEHPPTPIYTYSHTQMTPIATDRHNIYTVSDIHRCTTSAHPSIHAYKHTHALLCGRRTIWVAASYSTYDIKYMCSDCTKVATYVAFTNLQDCKSCYY